MTMRHVCSWQHQLLQEKGGASKRLLTKFASHLGKKLLLHGHLNDSCYAVSTGCAGPIEKLLLNLPKGETLLQGSCLMKESSRHSAGYKKM